MEFVRQMEDERSSDDVDIDVLLPFFSSLPVWNLALKDEMRSVRFRNCYWFGRLKYQ